MIFKSNTAKMVIALLACLIFVEAQSPMMAPVMSPGTPIAMAPAPDCVTAFGNVSDCLSYVSDGSTLTVPDKACCPEFAGLLESSPMCLCQLVASAKDFGVNITKALMLPGACKVATPSIDACPATPVSAPTPSPATDGPESSAGSDGGTAMTPAASGNGSNGVSSSAVHHLSTLICLAVAIFIAYYF